MQFTRYQKRFASWALIGAITGLFVWLLSPVLLPFLVAWILAYALNPLVNRLDGWFNGRMPRWLSVVMIEAVAVLMVVGAGRGPLVAASLRASVRAKRRLRWVGQGFEKSGHPAGACRNATVQSSPGCHLPGRLISRRFAAAGPARHGWLRSARLSRGGCCRVPRSSGARSRTCSRLRPA